MSWLQNLRQSAISRFAELGFPTTEDENWRFTSVAPIAKTRFKLADGYEQDSLRAEDLREVVFAGMDACRLVFVNGRYSAKLSSKAKFEKGDGICLESLAAALQSEPETIEQHLSRTAVLQGHSFNALNTAFFSDGAFVYLPEGFSLETPIHLLFISISNGQPLISHPRVLIVAGREAKAKIVESYVGMGSGNYFTNSVTELFVGENATVDYCKIQQENGKAFHVGSLNVRQDENSNFTSHSISFGGTLVRNDLNVALDAAGADCALNGLYMVSKHQHVDNHTTIDHAHPHGTSRELYKGILDGPSRAVFNGKIIVRPDAQKTDAMQTNKNLLLSEEGLIDTKPELKIFANDVKCKHGATIGQMDEEVLFYLRSRGIEEPAARALLVYAFASEMIDRIAIEPLKAALTRSLFSKLPAPVGMTV